MRLRHYRHVGPQPYQGFVTDQALLGDAIDQQTFLTTGTPGTIGVFTQGGNGLWQSETGDLGTTGQKFFLSQLKGTVTTNGVSKLTKQDSAVLVANPNYLKVTKKASVTPVKQTLAISDFIIPAEGGTYVITILDLSKKTGQENPTYSFIAIMKPSEVTGTLATDQATLVGKFITQINDPKNKVYHAWDTNLYEASATAGGVGIVLTTTYDNEAFTVAVSEAAAGATITNSGTVDGTAVAPLILGEGRYENVRDFEREAIVNEGYVFQEQRNEFFNDYPAPNFFACPTCTYTIYTITGTNPYKTIAEKPHVSNGWDINIKIAVSEIAPETIATTFDTVFAGIGVEIIS